MTPEERTQFDAMKRILQDLVYTIEHEDCQGYLFRDAEGLVCAEVPPLDLGLAYVRTCEVLGVAPKLLPAPQEETP